MFRPRLHARLYRPRQVNKERFQIVVETSLYRLVHALLKFLHVQPTCGEVITKSRDGPVPFGDVFEGRDELVVYSHMFYDGEPWEWQCEGCTRNSWPMQDAADAAYLNANGITFAILGDGPYEEIAAFRDFMGYTAPWYSNAHLEDPTVAHAGRIACYLRREDKIYLTYWTTGRGDEVMSPSFGLLDLTAYGRREEWEDSPEGWPQTPPYTWGGWHDGYDHAL